MSSAASDPDTTEGLVNGRSRSVAQIAELVTPGRPPTQEQSAIIEAGLAPMLVVAGAGSGKTETLSMRIVYLLDHAERLFGTPISPEEILCLTFTRKAAAEIAERADQRIATVFGHDPNRAPASVSTYNAFCAHLVAEHGLRLGIDPDATTLTGAALWQLANDVVQRWTDPIDTDAAVSTVTNALASFAAQLRDHGADPAQVRTWALDRLRDGELLPKKAGDAFPGPLLTPGGNFNAHGNRLKPLKTLAAGCALAEEFQRRKVAGSQLDFADQIAYGSDLATRPAVQDIERGRYRAVLLDEFQDTSPGQLVLFATLFGQGHHVMAVGDPYQAIYGFRGASESALPMFVKAFGGADVVEQASLSVSWRNEGGVLEAANAAAAPLKHQSNVEVLTLKSSAQHLDAPEPARAAPAIIGHVAETSAVEAQEVAAFLAARIAELEGGQRGGRSGGQPVGRQPAGGQPASQQGAAPVTATPVTATPVTATPVTAAILCRRRAQFAPMVEALIEAGLDYEVVGLGGLIDTPDVADLIALLEIAHDPGRGDSAMRLLTSERLALGLSDLAALWDWTKEIGGPRSDADRDTALGLVDALAQLPSDGWRSRDGRTLGTAVLERLDRLRRAIDHVRTRTYLPLPELILTAERAWGLDIEAAVARPDGRAARNIDAFIDAARSFASGADHATLGAFLAWLNAARQEENGLEGPVKEPEPGAVQILTIHAAKGLEWDVVAIPGMEDGRFPSVSPPSKNKPYYSDSGWRTNGINLPYEFRLDHADLPEWDTLDVVDHTSYATSLELFEQDCGTHKISEERRLFYVAITRARSHVLLSSAWRAGGKTVRDPSLFLAELVDQGIISDADWAPRPVDGEGEDTVAATAPWPRPETPAQAQRRTLASEVLAAMGTEDREGLQMPWSDLPLGGPIEAMLQEREERDTAPAAIGTPAHLTTSQLVSLERDADAFALSLRRPLPGEPTEAASRGTRFHQWIEGHYGHVPLVDLDDFDDAEEGDRDLLMATFAASEWADRTPSDIEVRVEVPIGGVTVRSRIDAVFPAGKGLDRVTVVDWKSGRPPVDQAERAAREVQLAVYRIAWARWKNLPIGSVEAAFYYGATGETVRPERLLDSEEIEALIQGRRPRKSSPQGR